MQAIQVENIQVVGSGWSPSERKGILRALRRIKLSSAAAPSGSGTYVTASDSHSAHASLNVEGALEATLWRLFSRVHMAVVQRAGLERSTCSFCRLHRTTAPSWKTRVGLALVVSAYMTRLVIQRMHIVG